LEEERQLEMEENLCVCVFLWPEWSAVE
jgi:hypothetical protein